MKEKHTETRRITQRETITHKYTPHTHTSLHSFWSATPQSSCEHLYIALMSILSVMIYSNRTSHCAEKFISSSLGASSHPPPRLDLLDVCACHVSCICPVVKYFSEQMDPGGGRQWVRGGSALCLSRSGRGPTWEGSFLASPCSRSSSPSLGTEVPETLNQLCFIHFIQKGSFKIQLRNRAGSFERQAMRSLQRGNGV